MINYYAMDRVIRISDLSEIYEIGIKDFAENLLKEKAERGETVVYSIDGQIVKLKASDALWIYDKFTNGIEEWEEKILKETAERGGDMHYWFDDQTLIIPARLVLNLFDRTL